MGIHGLRMRIIIPVFIALPVLVLAINYVHRQSMQSSNSAHVNFDKEVPVVGTVEKFNSILDYFSAVNNQAVSSGISGQASFSLKNSETSNKINEAVGNSWYSPENLSVSGVDESDTVKADESYIYQVGVQRVNIIKANPADEMNVVSSIKFKEGEFKPMELYLDKTRLLVIGTAYKKVAVSYPRNIKKNNEVNPYRQYSSTSILVYDISNRAKPEFERKVEIQGDYISSRRIGANVYFITSRPLDYSLIKNGVEDLPTYIDSAASDSDIKIGYDTIRYFPDSPQPNYINIGSFNIEKPNSKANIYTYLGTGPNIYMSGQNLYIIASRLNKSKPVSIDNSKETETEINKSNTAEAYQIGTAVYKFDLKDGMVKFSAEGDVPGTILNQFSLDEYNGYLRIATATTDAAKDNDGSLKNNIYILDGKLRTRGKLENVAPEEKIYSIGFIGDRAYITTMKTGSSLIAVDLRKPQNPKILGSLKIPEYSGYLEPYDQNHVIAFEESNPQNTGSGGEVKDQQNVRGSSGMKVAIFDIADIKKPVEMFNMVIGDSGTDSEILRDHKALLFDKKRNILAFPVNLMELKKDDKTQDGTSSVTENSNFTFQGAYVYNIDLTKGFKFKGSITHITAEEYMEPGHKWYDGDKFIQRILYINNNLYTVSDKMIKANSINDLKELKAVNIN